MCHPGVTVCTHSTTGILLLRLRGADLLQTMPMQLLTVSSTSHEISRDRPIRYAFPTNALDIESCLVKVTGESLHTILGEYE